MFLMDMFSHSSLILTQSFRPNYDPEATQPITEMSIARAERDGIRAETRFRLSPKQTNPFKSVGASVQSTAGSRGVSISFSNAG